MIYQNQIAQQPKRSFLSQNEQVSDSLCFDKMYEETSMNSPL